MLGEKKVTDKLIRHTHNLIYWFLIQSWSENFILFYFIVQFYE